MRIRGWHIEGFGIFHDLAFRGLGPGLNVFVGPNEAGKSTLLAFVRRILFGFPRRGGKDPWYPPLRGGRHGGRLFLEVAEGELIVERSAGRTRTVAQRLCPRRASCRSCTAGPIRAWALAVASPRRSRPP